MFTSAVYCYNTGSEHSEHVHPFVLFSFVVFSLNFCGFWNDIQCLTKLIFDRLLCVE